IHSSIVNPSCSERIVITTYISPIASFVKSSLFFANPSNNSPNSSPSFNACLLGSASCRLRSYAHSLILSVIVMLSTSSKFALNSRLLASLGFASSKCSLIYSSSFLVFHAFINRFTLSVFTLSQVLGLTSHFLFLHAITALPNAYSIDGSSPQNGQDLRT